MKNENAYGKKFDSLVKKICHAHSADPPPPLDPITQLVIGFLEWNATRRLALAAHEQLTAVMVDNNDLRVSLPVETVSIIGAGYPLAVERITRMREALQEIYRREYAVSLESQAVKPKKQVRTYIETLPGITPYVAHQVLLLNFGVHCIPVDNRLAELLRNAEVVEPSATVEEVSAFAERRIKAGDGVAVHANLRAWVDSKTRFPGVASAARKTEKPRSRKPAKKK